jgi:MFS family permease
MADVEPTTRKQSLKMAGVIAGSAIGMNTLFWLLAGFYYKGKTAQLDADMASIRLAFGALTLSVAVMAYVAGFAPRLVGHAIGFAAGLSALGAGFAALGTTIPGVVAAALIIAGLVLPVLSWRSLNHSRAAWSFLIAILAVFATVTFFGAPKMRHVLGIGLWYAMIIPAVEIVGVIALSMVRGEYRDPAVRSTSVV